MSRIFDSHIVGLLGRSCIRLYTEIHFSTSPLLLYTVVGVSYTLHVRVHFMHDLERKAK
jgi:hypothetical protein